MYTLISGCPATGKTTLLRWFPRRIDFDDWLTMYTGLPLREANELYQQKRSSLHKAYINHIKNTPDAAIADCLVTREERKEFLESLSEPVQLIYLVAPLDVLIERNKKRGSPISEITIVERYWHQQLPDASEGFTTVIYLKIIDNEVCAFGDEASLKASGGTFDMALKDEDWQAAECTASLENGRIVLGVSDAMRKEQYASAIRFERDRRLRKCDKMSPMRWNVLTDEQRQAWAEYRQALLDIPQQEGFPWGGDVEKVPWPELP